MPFAPDSLLRLLEAQVFGWDRIRQPDAVLGAVEHEPGVAHGSSANREHDRFAVARPDAVRGFRVVRKMNVVAAHSSQSILENGFQVRGRRAVIQRLWRFSRLEFQINGRAVTLVGTDAFARGIEAETLLFVLRDDRLKFFSRDNFAFLFEGFQKGIHADPTSRLEHQTNFFWCVSQVSGEGFADGYEVLVHAVSLRELQAVLQA